ncbi:hypothetical protein BH09PLA1_BH09PLA1_07030 [soil metagenome]
MWARCSLLAVACGLGVMSGAAYGDRTVGGKFQTVRPRVIPQPSWQTSNGVGLSHTFPSFNQVVDNNAGIPGLDPESHALTGMPAGVYTGFSVSVAWSAIAGDPYSSEAIWAFTDNSDLNSVVTFYADPGPASNSQSNGNPLTLNWSGFMDVPYTSGNPLYILMAQTFSGSSANWNNVSVTINDNTPTAPTAIETQVGGSISGNLANSEVKWFHFNYSGVGALDFNTLGSNVMDPDPNAFTQNDTEIGLYSAGGTLIDSNDDIDFSNGNYLSQLTFASGELPAGDYYLAVGGFNTDFGPAFDVFSDSAQAGFLNINGLSAVPEPASIGALALVGLFAARRRNRA